jgi:hypothetical protein
MTTLENITESNTAKLDWQKILSEWQERTTTETTTQFCKMRGISQAQFYYWRKRHFPQVEAKPKWLAVKIESSKQTSTMIKIHVANKLTIELSSQVEAECLSRLFSALGVV